VSSTGSISVSGLLGGTAGSIDTTSLIANLMQAAAVPQNQLKDQLTTVQNRQSALQTVNTKLTALLTAAQAVTDTTAWSASKATSSSSSVVASSDGTATAGTFTFDVTALARAQVSSVAVAGDGTVVADPTQGITLTDATGTAHTIALTSGAAADVASAINASGLNVRASVLTTDQGQILQIASTKTGAANAYTLDGFSATPQAVTAAADAKVTVGTLGSGGYTVTSSSNTFTNLWPGVTVTAGAVASGVTVTVDTDETSISTKVQALVNAANAASTQLDGVTGQGAVLEGRYELNGIRSGITDSVAQGGPNNTSLKKYGIDVDKTGAISFDADAFAAAFAADPAGTKAAVSGAFADRLATVGTNATAPVTGTVTQSLAEFSTQSDSLNTQIDKWTTRLSQMQSDLQAKYAAMETALAHLQSQQTYLTSMLKSATTSSSDSGS
jgi:flagellar hook-associated protein 2